MSNSYVLTWSGWEQSSHTYLYLCAHFLFMENIQFMKEAYLEAQKAFKEDEVPIGCVIVKDGEIIARAHNLKETLKDPTAHAEIECIKKATQYLSSKYLNECEMYVTLEPCLMCAGAIIQSRLNKIYVATYDPKGGSFKSSINIDEIKGLNHKVNYEFGLMEKECSEILKEFFKNKRD